MNRTRFIMLLIVVVGLISCGIALLTTEVVKLTGGEEFCGECHVMQPMVTTFKRDIHGGNNVHGFKAECVDCHLPHDSTLNYLVSKGTQGINDVVKVVFTDTDKIDWLSHRKLRESFVYDSGCLECHKTLLDKAQENGSKSQQMHQHYKVLQQTENPVACVSCHVTIGHNGELRNELNKTHPEYKYKKENAE